MEIFTIGHSTRTQAQLIEMLKAHGIQLLADIRTIPKSRKNPQFNREELEKALPRHSIEYVHLPELGGLRRPRADSTNDAWENASFRGYADYMEMSDFEDALGDLIERAKTTRVALMCAEGNPYRCHRSLVADALTARGVNVFHISSRRSASAHRVTPFAKIEGTRVTYPKT